jgi:geranylgeranyl diphosphate synthase type II
MLLNTMDSGPDREGKRIETGRGPPGRAALATMTRESGASEFQAGIDALRILVERRLDALLGNRPGMPDILEAALRHSLLAPCKRLRPILSILAARQFGGHERDVLDFACAIELVHTASLILDDLPSMDDALVRRQRATLHLEFGEDVAILTAIALLTQAFGVIARAPALEPILRVELVDRLSEAVGFSGLVAGQLRDLRDNGESKTLDGVASLNHQKTGMLFAAALEGGAAIAGASAAEIENVRIFAQSFGLAFQLWDDLLDVTSNGAALGKDAGQDAGKENFISLIGVEATRKAVAEAVDRALAVLADGPLREFSIRMFSQFDLPN